MTTQYFRSEQAPDQDSTYRVAVWEIEDDGFRSIIDVMEADDLRLVSEFAARNFPSVDKVWSHGGELVTADSLSRAELIELCVDHR